MKMTIFLDTAVCSLSIIKAIALMMETVHTSETSVYFNETTQRSIPDSCHLKLFPVYSYSVIARATHHVSVKQLY
jgi:hypothetical protein